MHCDSHHLCEKVKLARHEDQWCSTVSQPVNHYAKVKTQVNQVNEVEAVEELIELVGWTIEDLPG